VRNRSEVTDREVNLVHTVQKIWSEMGGSVRRYVGTRVRDPNVADDITQDVMLKVQSRLGELPPEDKLPAWILIVARNAVIDHYRARSVRAHADVHEIEPADVVAEDEPQGALRDLTPCVSRMIELLPEPYRQAMKLADINGLSQQELADRAGLSLSGAKSRVQRARQMLREMVLDCCRVERDGRGKVMDYQATTRSSRYCGVNDDGRPKCDGGA
jgi:RNA polymerase sigma-70 factor (ECF subfamily)